MDSGAALKRFELANNIQTVDPDQIYKYDAANHQAFLQAKPWAKDPHYFKHVRISAIALLKMVMHARSGGRLEVMGMMLGKMEGPTMIVTDTFALPVDGTETRVNAHEEANEYMVGYMSLIRQVGREENAIGWYHSHPGYGCWLSGIDVNTQLINQRYQEPFLAVVIDPTRTISAGKVEIGAFRTYPDGYKPPDEGPSEYQTIPMSKIEDFGVHCKQYYSIEVSYFKSTLDSVLLDKLWNKYWVNTLSSSPMFANRDYFAGAVNDLSEKLEQVETQLAHSGRATSYIVSAEKKKEESQLAKITKDSVKLTLEQAAGMVVEVTKDIIFNNK